MNVVRFPSPPTHGATGSAAIDWPAIRRVAFDSMIDLMHTAPEPTRTEAAVFLARHTGCCLMEVRRADARAIIAEAVEIVGQHVAQLEKGAVVH